MTLSLLTNSSLQDIVVYPLLFFAGVFSKLIHGRVSKKTASTSTLDTITSDYKAIRELYTTKCEEVKIKNEQLHQQAREILELRGRLRSYENFLQTRAPEMDSLIKAIAEKLEITTTQPIQGHEAAHSQVDKETNAIPNN